MDVEAFQNLPHQPGVVSDVLDNAAYVTLYLDSPQNFAFLAAVEQIKKDILRDFEEPNAAVLEVVVGISTTIAMDLFSKFKKSPQSILPYKTRKSKDGDMPATGGDVFFHVKGKRYDLVFEFTKRITQYVRSIKNAKGGSILKDFDEVYGWVYNQNKKNGFGRDLSGFDDGTENPSRAMNKLMAAVQTAKDDADGLGGGSFVMTQKWIHDKLNAFNAMPVSKQEEAVGRTKATSEALENKHIRSHVSRTVVRDSNTGRQMKVLRQSMPYGNAKEHGLFFICYTATLNTTEMMLDKMAGVDGGNTDFLMATLSKCVTGQYYYVPSTVELKKLCTATSKL